MKIFSQLFRRVCDDGDDDDVIGVWLLVLFVTAPNSLERDEDTDVDLIESVLNGTESTKWDHLYLIINIGRRRRRKFYLYLINEVYE